ncbi:MAG TPA: M14 family zinc carboxypeptidase [Candidatus Paceibacterota bacterium]|nr:M14 family zinc carboxypeptidase [Candidatus Paceibacterota bacterium]
MFEYTPIKTFSTDGRASIDQIYKSWEEIANDPDWITEVVYTQREIPTINKPSALPIVSFRTKKSGPAFWIISGIHGEEPAGPNALIRNIPIIKELAKNIPVVLFPLANPAGYTTNWRYFNEYREWTKGFDISDCDYMLPNKEDNQKPRALAPVSDESYALTQSFLRYSKEYPPLVIIDHHEDEIFDKRYIYSQGRRHIDDPIARYIIKLLENSPIPLLEEGETRFGETVCGGIVEPSLDGSIEEFFTSKIIFIDGKKSPGIGCETAITIETPVLEFHLEKRIEVHELVIKNYQKILSLRLDKNLYK